MSAILKLRKQEYEVSSGMTVREAILKHDIEPDTVIPTRDGKLISDDEIVQDGETIRLVAVISGGSRTPELTTLACCEFKTRLSEPTIAHGRCLVPFHDPSF